MMLRMKENAIKISRFSHRLRLDSRLTDILEIGDPPREMWSFRSTFKKSKSGAMNAVSISMPPDSDSYYEIALWDINKDELIYNNDFGYGDVRRFGSYEEVVGEIIRLDTNPIMKDEYQGEDQDQDEDQGEDESLDAQIGDLMKRVAALVAALVAVLEAK